MIPWEYPADRYYYEAAAPPVDLPPTDGEIKSAVVDRLRENPQTLDEVIRVDVKRAVVILTGQVGSVTAKRAAGDDCWDTPGVVDVSNQLVVVPRSGGNGTPRTVGEVMTPGPMLVQEGTTVAEAAEIMRRADVGDVLVAGERGLAGIVTDRDIAVRAVAAHRDPATTTVAEICSRDLVVVGPDEPLEQAARIMRDRAVRRLPVVEDGRPVGVVTLGDLAVVQDPDSALAEISDADANH